MGNSPSSAKADKDLLGAIDKRSKNLGSPRQSTAGRNSNGKTDSRPHMPSSMDMGDLSNILKFVQDLKRDEEGRKLLNEFIKAQSSEAFPDESDSISELLEMQEGYTKSFPISEIFIGKAS
jgi:hypothetical protein